MTKDGAGYQLLKPELEKQAYAVGYAIYSEQKENNFGMEVAP